MKKIILPFLVTAATLGGVQAQKKAPQRSTSPPLSIEQLEKPQNLVPNVPNTTQVFQNQYDITPINGANMAAQRRLPSQLNVVATNAFGFPTAISGVLPNSAVAIEKQTTDYLDAISRALHIANPTSEFEVTSTETDDLGQTHIRLEQRFEGLRVQYGELTLHTNAAGKIHFATGHTFPTANINGQNFRLSESEAVSKVVENLAANTKFSHIAADNLWLIGGEQFKAEKVIYYVNDAPNRPRLAWYISAYSSVLHRHAYFIDATSGDVLHKHENSCTFFHDLGEKLHKEEAKTPEHTLLDGAFTAQATDLLGIARTINTYQVGTKYYFLDASRPMFQLAASRLPSAPVGAIITYDNQNTDEGPYAYVSSTNNVWNNPKAVSSHYNAGQSYEYFRATFNRNSINGRGGNVVSFINVTDGGQQMDNAYWNGEAMFYGNGAQAFQPLARGLDVAGHEISHGVVQNSANLRYENESGALNESFADIFGAMIDRDDWRMGEDVVRTTYFPSGALRDLSNPHNGGTSLSDNGYQPRLYSERYTGTQDNGGVHINSGITNYAFYLFATNSSVGKNVAERVFYRALTTYLVASSRFIDLRAAVEQSCRDLYAAQPAVLTAAQNAFNTVGIGSGGSTTGTTYQTDLPQNPGADLLVWVSSNGQELRVATPTGAYSTISSRGIASRPSITDDGRYVVYVGTDKKMYYAEINWQTGQSTEYSLQQQAIWNNVAISRDGERIAANTGDSTLYIYSFAAQRWQTYILYNPTTAQNVNTGEVRYSDALEWDYAGENVMYDAFNKLTSAGGFDIEYWDVGFIKVWNKTANTFDAQGRIQKLFTQLPENTSIGNATFAKRSPYIVAFDFIDETDPNNPDYFILCANVQTGAVTQASTGIFNNSTIAYPSFSNNDGKILFTNLTQAGALQLATINLQTNKLEPVANSGVVVKTAAQKGVWFANGSRPLSTKETLPFEAVHISPNPVSDALNIQLDFTPSADSRIQMIDMLGRVVSDTPLSTNTQITLNTEKIVKGVFVVRIISNGKTWSGKVVKE